MLASLSLTPGEQKATVRKIWGPEWAKGLERAALVAPSASEKDRNSSCGNMKAKGEHSTATIVQNLLVANGVVEGLLVLVSPPVEFCAR
jgi:hypothetical protein